MAGIWVLVMAFGGAGNYQIKMERFESAAQCEAVGKTAAYSISPGAEFHYGCVEMP
jgi:hypothetical protein